MDYKDLDPELLEKAQACKTSEELIALANAEGIELSGEELEAISGGSWGGYFEGGCSTHVCGDYDCSVFMCRTVDCRNLDCTIF